MAKQAKHVYAFEPDKWNYHTLQRNIELNGLAKNVSLYSYARDKKTGHVTLYKCAYNNGMRRVYKSKWCKAGKEGLPIVALDAILEHVDFIKTDIEGAKCGALLGMPKY
jgi:FkbM family methyltransferase